MPQRKVLVQQAHEAATAVSSMTPETGSLVALCTALNRLSEALVALAKEGHEPDLELMDLPKFGGEAPSNRAGIYSWDATSVLVEDGAKGWAVIPRDEEERDAWFGDDDCRDTFEDDRCNVD